MESEHLGPVLQRYQLVMHRNWEPFPSLTAIAQESVNWSLTLSGRGVGGKASNQSIARPVRARSVGSVPRRSLFQCSGDTTVATSNCATDAV